MKNAARYAVIRSISRSSSAAFSFRVAFFSLAISSPPERTNRHSFPAFLCVARRTAGGRLPVARDPDGDDRLLRRPACSLLLEFLLQLFEVEARALLHGRKLDQRLGRLRDLLLHV